MIRPARVRTVLGDIEPNQLGVTDYHEHLFQSTPLLPGDSLDDEVASTAEAGALLQSGATAMVEATPLGLGRRPSAVARASAATGLHVVHTSGAHREAHRPASALAGLDHPGLPGHRGRRRPRRQPAARRRRRPTFPLPGLRRMPGLQYLFDRFVPRLRRQVGDQATNAILVDNPARWLAWSPAARP